MALDSVADHARPWVDHYPEGITWDVALNLTPVHEQVLASCDKHANDTALDFLGFGLPPGSPSLGELLAQGKANLQAPWLGLSGFAVIALTLSLLIFAGEAVRDAFDPRKAFG